MADVKQLIVVLEIANKKEQQAMQMLVEARQQLQNLEQQLTGLMQYRNDYLREMSSKGQSGVAANALRQLQQFVGRMDQAVEQQQQKVAGAKHAVSSRQESWQQARQHQQSIEFLINKRQQEQQQRELKQEQKMLDEFTTMQFARRSP